MIGLIILLVALVVIYVAWLVYELKHAPDEHELWHADHDECVKTREADPS